MSAFEQRLSKQAQYLRDHRLRITLLIAVPEGILILLGDIPTLMVYVVAVVAIAFWVSAGRTYTSPVARDASWIFAASQALAVLTPIILNIAKWAAFGLVGLLAVGALVLLFSERGKP